MAFHELFKERSFEQCAFPRLCCPLGFRAVEWGSLASFIHKVRWLVLSQGLRAKEQDDIHQRKCGTDLI